MPLTDEEKIRAAEFRRQASRKLKLAKILLAEELPDEAIMALRESARLAGCALAVEARAPDLPATLTAALAPPLSYRWGAAAAQLQALATGADVVAPGTLIDAVSRALSTTGMP